MSHVETGESDDMIPIVCFISDFGLDDTWVGVCHATVISTCSAARVVDIAHGIAPYDLRAGAITAAAATFQLPDAIHLVVVDPGVGGSRRALCLQSVSGTVMLGPDNGVLLPAALRRGAIGRAFELDPEGALPTFHARDVFARAAGRLACGAEPTQLGAEIDVASLVPGPFEMCARTDGDVHGEVLGPDRFGSLRFNVPTERLAELGLSGRTLKVDIGHNTLRVPQGVTFSDVAEGEPVMVADSSGWLTLAINQGSAADRFGVTPGARVRLSAAV